MAVSYLLEDMVILASARVPYLCFMCDRIHLQIPTTVQSRGTPHCNEQNQLSCQVQSCTDRCCNTVLRRGLCCSQCCGCT